MSRQPGTAILIDRSFRIVEETDDWLVVDKPAHLLIHPTRPDGIFTLWEGLRELCAFEIACGGQISIINRLDRETSGLVLAAKNSPTARLLCGKMEALLIQKSYLAVVAGWPVEDSFVVDAPLRRQGEVKPSTIWVRQMVHPEGAAAVTEFTVLRRVQAKIGPLALLQAVPKTGRTHQIRVHLAEAGFPVVGDKIYGPDEQCYLDFIETGWTLELARKLHLPRQALHSASLKIPAFGHWQAALPDDLESLLGNVVHTDDGGIFL